MTTLNKTLNTILTKHKDAYNVFKSTEELDSNSDFYSDLFDYFLNSDDSNFYQTIKDCTDNEYITNVLLKNS